MRKTKHRLGFESFNGESSVMNKTNSDIFDYLEKYRNDIVEIQTKLTSIPALGPENGGDGEAKKAEYIKTLLGELQYNNLEELNAPDDRVKAGYRPNLLVKIKGKSDKKTIWIMSHMDIVPPGDLTLWKTDPYQVVEKDGILYGRGVEDNHQGFISSLLAVRALREKNIVPEHDVGLAIVSDEEMGSGYGGASR